jgi:hypothetical protein
MNKRDLSDFIPNYPLRTDEDFMEDMVRRTEFRELLEDPFSYTNENTFFYNAQTMIGRWLAPWTNNRALLVRADPGVGKTRMAISFISTWMEHSDHRRALVIADTKTILKAFADEIVEFKQHTKVMEAREWVVGKKSHGKSISTTRFVKSSGLESTTPIFIEHVAKEIGVGEFIKDIYIKYDTLAHMTQEESEEDNKWTDLYDAYQQLRQELRRRYSKHSVVIDEVHIFRRSADKEKQSYGAILLLLDALRDLCPILILTATPIVDTWRDLMSIIGMLYPVEMRDEIQQDMDDGDMSITDMVKKWGAGLVSDRTSEGVVPAKRPIPGHDKEYTLVLEREEDNEVLLDEDVYPVFMSDYQTLFTASYETRGQKPESLTQDTVNEVSSQTGVYSWRKYYDFVPPSIEEEGSVRIMTMDELITKSEGRYVPSKTSYINAGEESIFDIKWEGERPSTTTGLGKYSAKAAELIRMMKYDKIFQGKAGYLHTLWVEYGTKPLAAALSANGWQQYTGVGEVTVGSKPKFAVIHGSNLSSTKINNIIAAFNSEDNRDGSVIKLIIGSKKSGVSISFTTAQFFLEFSSTFNRSVTIQSKGRVYRASSLRWMRRLDRIIYSAVVVALPSLQEGSDDAEIEEYRNDIAEGRILEKYYYSLEDNGEEINITPYTIELRLSFLSQEKFDVSSVAMDALKSISIENEYDRYADEPSNDLTYNLIYANRRIERTKEIIKKGISRNWNVSLEGSTMIESMSIASLISNQELVLSNYGIPSPVKDVGDVVSSYRGKIARNPLSLVYNQNFFITDDERSYNTRIVTLAISVLSKSSTDEYDFYHLISSATPSSVRVFLLEMSLSRDKTVVNAENGTILDSRKSLILGMYASAWNSFEPSSLVHILWYLIRSSSYVSKLGITSAPEGKSRILSYDRKTKAASGSWRYERNPDTESVYLSSLARSIYDSEMEAIGKSKKSGFYVHFSLADGAIRIRQINLEDLRRSKFFSPNDRDVSSFVRSLLSSATPVEGDLSKRVYYAAKEKGILIIR